MPSLPIFFRFAFVILGAAANPGEHKFCARFIVQVDGGFQTAEGQRDLVRNFMNKLVKIEDRRYLLRCLLQL